MQETRTAESGVREAGQYGYALYLSGGVEGKRRYGGVGFAVRDAINTFTLDFHACRETGLELGVVSLWLCSVCMLQRKHQVRMILEQRILHCAWEGD
jgi:hypothetical protein